MLRWIKKPRSFGRDVSFCVLRSADLFVPWDRAKGEEEQIPTLRCGMEMQKDKSLICVVRSHAFRADFRIHFDFHNSMPQT